MLKTFFDSRFALANVGRYRPSHPVENFFFIFFDSDNYVLFLRIPQIKNR